MVPLGIVEGLHFSSFREFFDAQATGLQLDRMDRVTGVPGFLGCISLCWFCLACLRWLPCSAVQHMCLLHTPPPTSAHTPFLSVLSPQALEEDAAATQRRMDAANTLISALGGEEVRWTQQSKLFDDIISRLIGDCAIASR